MKKRTAIFRCDGGPNIGNGHILRELILAEHLKKKNIRIIFLIKQCSLFLKNLVKSNFRIITLKKDSFKEIKKKIYGLNCYYFIIDHYNFSFSLEKKISALAKKIIVIEDFPKKKHIANLIIDQNLNRKKKDYVNLKKNNSKLLIGPKYTLIDTKLRKISINKNKNKISNILMCFGGFDGHKLNLRILKYLQKIERKFKINVLLNRDDNYYKQVLDFFKKNKISGRVCNNRTLLKVIKNVDFAIISGGIIAKEIIASQIPCMIISTSKDQFKNCIEYNKLSRVKYIGKWHTLKKNFFIYHFRKVLDLEESLLNKKNKRIFDFNGPTRISNEILKL